jgi:hypothetical protein
MRRSGSFSTRVVARIAWRSDLSKASTGLFASRLPNQHILTLLARKNLWTIRSDLDAGRLLTTDPRETDRQSRTAIARWHRVSPRRGHSGNSTVFRECRKTTDKCAGRAETHPFFGRRSACPKLIRYRGLAPEPHDGGGNAPSGCSVNPTPFGRWFFGEFCAPRSLIASRPRARRRQTVARTLARA